MEDYHDIDVELTYLQGSGAVTGSDRFGRIVDQLWVEYGTSPAVTLDEYTYTYDRAGNVHSKTNATEAALDEVYGYNNLDELTSVTRNGSAYESWDLDSLGNWLTSTDGGTTDTKTFDPANEETSSTASATSQYDAAGNATVTGEPSNETTGLTCVYDAWNRLVGDLGQADGVPQSTIRMTELAGGQPWGERGDPPLISHDNYYGPAVGRSTHSGESARAGTSTSGRRFTSIPQSCGTPTTAAAILFRATASTTPPTQITTSPP